MNTKIILGIVIVLIVGAVGWWLISPAFRTIEANEPSPLNTSSTQAPTLVPEQTPIVEPAPAAIKDGVNTMDAKKKAEFEKQTAAMKDKVMQKKEAMPKEARVVAQGAFMKRYHDVKGKGLLIKNGEKYTVRFEDFESIDGPDLHIYLSSGLNNDDYVDLGSIKATKGNVNYDVPVGTDIKKYMDVLVWCKPFGVLFSYAELR